MYINWGYYALLCVIFGDRTVKSQIKGDKKSDLCRNR